MGYQFVVYEDKAGEWRWQLQSIGNRQIIATPHEGYRNRADCLAGIALVKAYAPGAPIVSGTLS